MTAATLQRPALELAQVVRRHAHRLNGLSGEQQRILRSIAACRTAELGGHVQTCDHCRHQRIAYNSCRNRHCPRCQASACARWMEQRATELLPVEYFHVVFTLPDDFNALALANKRIVYGMLFEAAAQTLLQVAGDPRHLGARIGFLSILHTWGQNLCLHPHVHCVVPGGGLLPDGSGWVSCRRGFLLHAAPAGFMRIRHYGLLANRLRLINLQRCRTLLGIDPPAEQSAGSPRTDDLTPEHEQCPFCRVGRLICGPSLTPTELKRLLLRLDSS